MVAVYIPEYVVGRWWEQLLHNQTALRLKGRLLFTPGVMVTSVPYQLRSSELAREREERDAARTQAGDLRRATGLRAPGPPGPLGQSRLMARRPRPRKSPRALAGRRAVHAEVGPVAHGGHCVVRLDAPDNRVVFVRHALPGEPVVVEITEGTEGDRFWRGDAVEVLAASPDRVDRALPRRRARACAAAATSSTSRCRRSGRSRPPSSASSWSASAGLDRPTRVTALEVECRCRGDDRDGLRWRTRVRYARTADGRRGMRKHRSHDVVPVDDCLIATPGRTEPTRRASSVTEQVVTGHGTSGVRRRAADGFWQVHPGAPRVLVETVLDLLRPQPGERALDLYAGVGLFAGFLLDAVGPPGGSSPSRATATACGTPAPTSGPGVRVRARAGRPGARAGRTTSRSDLVVLDPPREGAKRPVVEQVVGPRAARRGLRRLRPGGARPRRRDLRRARLPADRRCAPSTCSR